MRKRLIAVIVLFIVLALSTISYSGFIAYRVNQLDTSSEKTEVMGYVVDSEGDPLEDVVVDTEFGSTNTTSDGSFYLNVVEVGIVEFHFYLPGYVPLELSWLCYPDSDYGEDLEGSPNNISTEEEIVLWREMETIYEEDHRQGGSLTLIYDISASGNITGETLEISDINGTIVEETLGDNGQITVDGSYDLIFSLAGDDTSIKWNLSPGDNLDITPIIEYLWGSAEILDMQKIRIDLNITGVLPGQSIIVEFMDPSGTTISREINSENGDHILVTEELSIGRYEVRITGPAIRDLSYIGNNLDDNITEIELYLEQAEPDRVLEGLDLTPNFILALIMFLIGCLFFLGVYLTVKGKNWLIPLAIALLGFLARGMYIEFVNVNMLIASAIVILLFISREDFQKRMNEKKKGEVQSMDSAS